ncbi:MAG: grasp-with-spasm system ATP-grasp peptide maturase [Flavobacterium sp.]|nr:grasp-with-spasm system ATP-grasp peptide maturase [Flavobacterium sp.]
MILIIGYREENAVQEVLSYVYFLNKKAIVIGHDEFEKFVKNFTIADQKIDLQIEINSQIINFSEIELIWYRKTALNKTIVIDGFENEPNLLRKIYFNLEREINGFKNGIYELFLTYKKSLGHPYRNDINKFHSLINAKSVGLNIPDTFTSTSFNDINDYLAENRNTITKSIQDSLMAVEKENVYSLYTQRISADDLIFREGNAFPSLFQNEISKEFEIRTFYLNEKCYSMAIFSQLDEKTTIDFRDYNWQKMNRMVPYNLPIEISEKINSFMKLVNLNTGSIDLIKTTDGKYVFLEVNPVGQFGFVSNHCNYYLEEEIANYLVQ